MILSRADEMEPPFLTQGFPSLGVRKYEELRGKTSDIESCGLNGTALSELRFPLPMSEKTSRKYKENPLIY